MMHVHLTLTRSFAVLLIAAVACGASPAVLAGCGEDPGAAPAGRPDQTGNILAVTPGSGDVLGTVLVGSIESMREAIVGEASVSLTADTVWMSGGKVIPAPTMDVDLLGRRVEVKFTGPVAESFPVQATADWVRLLPMKASGIEGRTMVAGGPPPGDPRPDPGEPVEIRWGGESGPTIRSLTSDQSGAFHVDLQPGLYWVTTLQDDDAMTDAATVLVDEGAFPRVRLVESVR